jgi:membrane protein DedA with SNARE-associated domain
VDWLIDWLIRFASERDHPLGLAALAGSSLIEYVFPPFPGDTITLLGAVLITGYAWSWWAIAGAVMAGSLAGAYADYWLGLRLRARPRRPEHAGRWAAIDRVVARFQRHGPAYLILNRFVPGIRALFFLAAGLAGMRRRDVLLFGGLSVALWCALLLAAGAALGANLDALERWFRRYTTVIWILLAAAALLYIGARLLRRRRAGRALGRAAGGGPGPGARGTP